MIELEVRLLGVEIIKISFGEPDDDEEPEEKMDPSGISAADSERAPAASPGVWGDGHDRPGPIMMGFGVRR